MVSLALSYFVEMWNRLQIIISKYIPTLFRINKYHAKKISKMKNATYMIRHDVTYDILPTQLNSLKNSIWKMFVYQRRSDEYHIAICGTTASLKQSFMLYTQFQNILKSYLHRNTHIQTLTNAHINTVACFMSFQCFCLSPFSRSSLQNYHFLLHLHSAFFIQDTNEIATVFYLQTFAQYSVWFVWTGFFLIAVFVCTFFTTARLQRTTSIRCNDVSSLIWNSTRTQQKHTCNTQKSVIFDWTWCNVGCLQDWKKCLLVSWILIQQQPLSTKPNSLLGSTKFCMNLLFSEIQSNRSLFFFSTLVLS